MVPAARGSGRDSPDRSITVRDSRVRNTSARKALGPAGSGQASQERVSTGRASQDQASQAAPTSDRDSRVKDRTAQASTDRASQDQASTDRAASQDQASTVPGQVPTAREQGSTGLERASTDPEGHHISHTRARTRTPTLRAGTGTARDPAPRVPPRTRGDAAHPVRATGPRRSGPVLGRWDLGSRAADRTARGSLVPVASTDQVSTAPDLTARRTSGPISTAAISTAAISTAAISTAAISTAAISTGLDSTGRLDSTDQASMVLGGKVLASRDHDRAVDSHVRVRKGQASGDHQAAGRVRAGRASSQAGDSGSRATPPGGSATRPATVPCLPASATPVRGRTRAAP
jgi:hypothetical protein